MSIKIEMLRCFAIVARRGKLSEAAAQLGRTPSAVSMMLKQLEGHLGEPLFETDRKNKLSALGEFVLEQAEHELRQFDSTIQAIEGYAKARRGRVRIAAVPSVAGSILPQAILNYSKDFPDVKIELRDMDSASVLREVMRERVDLGIATANQHSGSLNRQDLLSDAFGLVCPALHPLARLDRPLSWEDLPPHHFIANDLSAQIPAEASRQLHEGSLLKVHNMTSLLAMVQAGLGVTILPEMTAKLAESYGLIFCPLADASTRRQIHLLRKADTPASPAARELERQIIATVADLQPPQQPDQPDTPRQTQEA
ncbi:LysR family transcriptional regulator [Pseudophaeobacter sp.]|uniref:LysR family transcriptional regulator n=1 Tax=Pseudophaeobacter sp. TaxID=1971739 RepID=UPI0040583F4C